MIHLYGSPITRAQRVMWMLDELGLEYEQIPYGVPSQLGPVVPREEIEKLNPSGKVPILVDGDLVLTESYAINLHLARQYESDLTPRTPEEWAKALQWTLWMATEIENDVGRVLAVRRSGLLDSLSEEKRKEDALTLWGIRHRLGVLETALASETWLVGGRFTVADLNLASMLTLAEPSGTDLSDLPRVSEWLAACLARPAAKKAWGTVMRDARAFGFVGDLEVS